jgi:hypothetical protein
MGRPLKTAKYNVSASTWVDAGYPNDGTTDNGFSTNYPGVFGGVDNDEAVSPYVAIEDVQKGTINSTSGITVIWANSGGIFYNNELVSVGSTIYAAGLDDAIGTVNTINTPASVTCDSAAASTDLILTKGATAATALVVDGPVTFDLDFAGLTAGVVYYVKATPDSTHFSVSLTPGGAAIQLTDDSDDVTATQGHTITLDAGATATVTNSVWTSSTPDDGFIIRQKGKKKFLAGRRQTINDEFIVAGGSYYIVDPSDTNWEALGAGPDAAAGKIFTAKINGTGLATNGTVYSVGVCTLTEAQESALTRRQMSVLVDKASGTDTWASSVTNHFVLDFTDNGTDENMGAKYIASLDGKTNTPDAATGLTTIDLEYWC